MTEASNDVAQAKAADIGSHIIQIDADHALEYADKIGEFLKEQLHKSGMDGYVLGLSGGIDSAVCAYLCKRAGIDLYTLVMPYGKTMDGSGSSARVAEIISDLGLEDHSLCIDIKPACKSAELRREELLHKFPCNHPRTGANFKLAGENRRARQRMIELYDFAQVHRLLVLGTSNLSEYVTGYFTKYGDDASDVEPLLYIPKSGVYALGKALGVPKSVLEAAPSAELSSDQTDEDDLGFSYAALEDFLLSDTLFAPDCDIPRIRIVQRIAQSQHKRGPRPVFKG